ncbi:M1 family metallopeptidase [Aquincola tertiaricarbonis]|uniref:M1 family metallopeptidase n=1 Tax=Aquincola tertiaricarbonis TaxID=391953 RepID=UPI00069728B2|nr:M1 family metallopeptidase [Aquincola tertiaricarbonis]
MTLTSVLCGGRRAIRMLKTAAVCGPLMALPMALPLALLPATTAVAQPRFDFAATPGRLSKQVVPTHYQLLIDADPARDGFQGEVTIRVDVRQRTDAIVLNAHQLQATGAMLHDASGLRPLDVVPDEARQTWRLVPQDGQPIAVGPQRIEIDYTGTVQKTGQGLFRADYRDITAPADAPAARTLATQLEAIYARSVLPAFDEPVFRAVFELSVRAPAGQQVVANMPLQAETPEADGRVLHRFAPTPPMPSYLLGFTIGRFDVLEGSAGALPLRILTAPGKREQARFALTATEQLLGYFTDYFGQPYALPKLDQHAVPSTRWGAMEDWGLISYAEGGLLVDPARSTPDTPRRVFNLLAHEIAHQWFGNLVTAASWEEIWLNEAFATWMATRASEHFHPEWQVRLRERGWVEETMAEDSGQATRAIRSGRVDEQAIWDVFDNITYAKGGAVLSMIEQWLGPEVFQRGLAAYMADRRFSNATAGDLWHHIGQAAGRDVRRVAASWTDQRGFPLVQLSSRCVRGRTEVTLAQRRFTAGPADRMQRTWHIPVRLARVSGGEEPPHTVMLDQPRRTVQLPGCSDAPLLANAGGRGFYRVQYTPAHQRALAAAFTELAPADRVALMADAFALARAGEAPLDGWFALLAAAPRVQDDSRGALLTMALHSLEALDAVVEGLPVQARLHEAARALLAPELARLGWQAADGEGSEPRALRNLLIRQLAGFGDAEVLARAQALFDADEAGREPLPAAIRSGVIGAVGARADGPRFGQLLQRLQSAQGDEDRWTYARALASGRDEAQARRLLEAALAGIAPPNVASTLPSLLGTQGPFGEMAYRHVLDHWAGYEPLAGMQGRQYLLPGAAGRFVQAGQAAALLADQARLVGKGGALTAGRQAEQIRLNARMRQRDVAALDTLLKGWRPGAP